MTETTFLNLEDIPRAVKEDTAEGARVKLPGQKSWVEVRSIEQTTITIWYSKDFVFDAQYVAAALNATSEYLDVDVDIVLNPDIQYSSARQRDINVWLSETIPSDGVDEFELLYKPNSFSKDLITRASGKYLLTKRLNRDIVFENDLAAALFPLIYDADGITTSIDSVDNRIMSLSPLKMSRKLTSVKNEQVKASSSSVLWVALVLLLVVERFISFQRKQ